ncbi:MAG: phage terminase small subunit [Sphingomonas parapaucimobilis]
MSPAQRHRERLAATAAGHDPAPATPKDLGGQTAPAVPDLTPARAHQLAQAMAANAATPEMEGRPIDPAAAQILLRLRHDLRRLKAIQSIERKGDAKREMLPEYRAWCDHQLECGRMTNGHNLGSTGANDVLPTIMIWSIDTGDWARAIELAEHVIRFDIPLPTRYQRQAAPLIAEEFAEAALKIQARGEAFPVDVLEEVELLTDDADMHDEIRAKLMKAIGTEYARKAEAALDTPAFAEAAGRALAPLKRAQDLHGRVGVKVTIQRLEKAQAKAAPADPAQV